MNDRDGGGGFFGFFGFIEAILAIIGAITVMGIAAVAISVFAWEMELRKSEEREAAEPPAAPTA